MYLDSRGNNRGVENMEERLIILYSRSLEEGLERSLTAEYYPCALRQALSEGELDELIQGQKVILLVLGRDLTLMEREKALLAALKLEIRTAVIPGAYESLLAEPVTIGDIPLVFFPAIRQEQRERWQWLHRASALLLLLLTSPLLVVIAIIIRLDSRGPVFYWQERVGHKGKTFALWKFRTMVTNAEAQSGPVFCQEDDQRITRVGRFLRHAHLDELPQLLNIVRGEMKWVGPRPERPAFVRKFRKYLPAYELRHLIPPGLTGQAQIRVGYDASPEAKLSYDLQHLRCQGLWEETRVLLATIPSIFHRKGR